MKRFSLWKEWHLKRNPLPSPFAFQKRYFSNAQTDASQKVQFRDLSDSYNRFPDQISIRWSIALDGVHTSALEHFTIGGDKNHWQFFSSPLTRFESKKYSECCWYSERETYVILTNIVTIAVGHFLIQKGDRRKPTIMATTGFIFRTNNDIRRSCVAFCSGQIIFTYSARTKSKIRHNLNYRRLTLRLTKKKSCSVSPNSSD